MKRTSPIFLRRAALVAAVVLVQFGCGGGSDGKSGKNSLVAVGTEPPGANCASGGQRVDVGVDANQDDALDTGEISRTVYVCDGASGAGAVATAEEPGSHCAAGGVKVQVGTADPTYVCNGPGGLGGQSVTLAQESPGANCLGGGVKLQVGNGTPDYVCNGSGAAGESVSATPEPAGANCTSGGVKLQVGAANPSYVCNGTAGADGQGVAVTAEPAGANCTSGGVKLQVGGGSPRYACNGVPGTDGASVTTTPEAAGKNCTYGGVSLQVGGALSYVCNGAPGKNGTDSVCAWNTAPVITSIDVPADPLYAGTPATVTVHADDADGQTLSYAIAGPGGTFSGGSNGVFTFLPGAVGGPYSYSVLVSDGCQLALGSFSIASVKQGWTFVGDRGFGATPWLTQSIAVFEGEPFVAYWSWSDGAVNRLETLAGSSWIAAEAGAGPVAQASMSDSALMVHGGELIWASQGHAASLSEGVWTPLPDYSTAGGPAVKLFSTGADLYVAYFHREDGSSGYNYRVGVKKLDTNGSAWVPVSYGDDGTGIGAWAYGGYTDLDLAVSNGKVYVEYTAAFGPGVPGGDEQTNRMFTVMTDASGSWNVVGAPEVASVVYHTHLAVSGGSVYVAVRAGSVWRFDGSAWEELPGVALGEEPLLAVHDGALYVVGTTGGYMQLFELRGTSWVAASNVSPGGTDAGAGLSVEGDTFYVSFSDAANDGRLSLMAYTLQ